MQMSSYFKHIQILLIVGLIPAALPATPSAQQANQIRPEELLKILQSSQGEKPILIQVGSHVLYSQAHIPGSEYIGPAFDANSLPLLRHRVGPLSRKAFIVLYCGCCPWNHCPNIKPAQDLLGSPKVQTSSTQKAGNIVIPHR
jgi:thiosulfate/3-mercaptopyruvate sulfurtransferase